MRFEYAMIDAQVRLQQSELVVEQQILAALRRAYAERPSIVLREAIRDTVDIIDMLRFDRAQIHSTTAALSGLPEAA